MLRNIYRNVRYAIKFTRSNSGQNLERFVDSLESDSSCYQTLWAMADEQLRDERRWADDRASEWMITKSVVSDSLIAM